MFKTMLFFGFMALIVFPAAVGFRLGFGNFQITGTKLTADVTAVADTLNVVSTTGFPLVGVVTIDGEEIRYTKKTATTFTDIPAQAMARGFAGTTAAAHSRHAVVRPIQLGTVNSALETKMANIADSAGIARFVAVADAAWTMLLSFFTSPFGMPAELAIVTLLWVLMGVLFFVYLGLTLAGSRRV